MRVCAAYTPHFTYIVFVIIIMHPIYLNLAAFFYVDVLQGCVILMNVILDGIKKVLVGLPI